MVDHSVLKQWPKSWLRAPDAWVCILCGLNPLLGISTVDGPISRTLGLVFGVGPLLAGAWLLWRAYQTRSAPGAELDETNLRFWNPRTFKLERIPIWDIERVEASGGWVSLRLRRVGLRRIGWMLRARDRAELVGELRNRLAEQGRA